MRISSTCRQTHPHPSHLHYAAANPLLPTAIYQRAQRVFMRSGRHPERCQQRTGQNTLVPHQRRQKLRQMQLLRVERSHILVLRAMPQHKPGRAGPGQTDHRRGILRVAAGHILRWAYVRGGVFGLRHQLAGRQRERLCRLAQAACCWN
jgi:hypothetical protein